MAPRSVDTDKLTSVQRILERAIEVIDEGGEVAIRTNVIAKECGVTAPILYRAFGNREGLIVAAQAERYRRSKKIVVDALVRYIEDAKTKEDLMNNIRQSLDLIFDSSRSANRELRAEVIGSAVSRPALREAVVAIDREYAGEIVAAYQRASDEGWIRADINLNVIALWAQAVVNANISAEFTRDTRVAREWTKLSSAAIMHAIFGES